MRSVETLLCTKSRGVPLSKLLDVHPRDLAEVDSDSTRSDRTVPENIPDFFCNLVARVIVQWMSMVDDLLYVIGYLARLPGKSERSTRKHRQFSFGTRRRRSAKRELLIVVEIREPFHHKPGFPDTTMLPYIPSV